MSCSFQRKPLFLMVSCKMNAVEEKENHCSPKGIQSRRIECQCNASLARHLHVPSHHTLTGFGQALIRLLLCSCAICGCRHCDCWRFRGPQPGSSSCRLHRIACHCSSCGSHKNHGAPWRDLRRPEQWPGSSPLCSKDPQVCISLL